MKSKRNKELADVMINIMPAIIKIPKTQPTPARNSKLTGAMYYNELMSTASFSRFREVARMDLNSFKLLLVKLNSVASTARICKGQRLMIFLYTLTGKSSRDSQERFQHSGDTISKIVHEVARAIILLQDEYIRMDFDPEIPSQIRNNSKYFPYFQDCIGAIDGTHIAAAVSTSIATPFRNRKGFLSQNVLAVSHFDMTFAYALAGWEGSAHDGRVYEDSLGKGFPARQGKYYLGDAGYALSSNILTPYRGTRYHLQEWGHARTRPTNSKELFNLRHSSLRNTIERLFGVLKKRFPTLTTMPTFAFEFQVDIVKCIFIIHNHIRATQHYEDFFDRQFVIIDSPPTSDHYVENDNRRSRELIAWRDGIAENMWNDYQATHRDS